MCGCQAISQDYKLPYNNKVGNWTGGKMNTLIFFEVTQVQYLILEEERWQEKKCL